MDLLSRDYAIRDICGLMGVSRSGYYKWECFSDVFERQSVVVIWKK